MGLAWTSKRPPAFTRIFRSYWDCSVKRAAYFSEGAGRDDCESDDLPRPVYLQMGKVRGPG